MISESVEVIRMVATGMILVNKDLQTIVFIIPVYGILMPVGQNIIRDFHQKIETLRAPDHLIAAAKIFGFWHLSQPKLINGLPGGNGPTLFLRSTVDLGNALRPRRLIRDFIIL